MNDPAQLLVIRKGDGHGADIPFSQAILAMRSWDLARETLVFVTCSAVLAFQPLVIVVGSGDLTHLLDGLTAEYFPTCMTCLNVRCSQPLHGFGAVCRQMHHRSRS